MNPSLLFLRPNVILERKIAEDKLDNDTNSSILRKLKIKRNFGAKTNDTVKEFIKRNGAFS